MKKRLFFVMVIFFCTITSTSYFTREVHAEHKFEQLFVDCSFEEIGEFGEGLFPACIRDKEGKKRWGYVNEAGEVVIDFKWHSAKPFSDGLALVGAYPGESDFTDDTYFYMFYFIDKTGEKALDFITVDTGRWNTGEHLWPVPPVKSFSEGLAGFSRFTTDVRYMDTQGIEVIGDENNFNVYVPATMSFRDFHDGLVAVYVDSKWGYANKTGDIVIEPKYRSVTDFSEGLAWVELNENEMYFIDKQGNPIVELNDNIQWIMDRKDFKGYTVHGFSEGLAIITTDKNYVIDKKGKLLFEAERHGLETRFNEGLAFLIINGVWGYVNTEGKTVFATVFITEYGKSTSHGDPFKNGYALVHDRVIKHIDTERPKIFINGAELTTDYGLPYTKNNRVMVSLLPLVRALNIDIEWDIHNNIKLMIQKNDSINIQIDSKVIKTNGVELVMDVPVEYSQGVCYVPIKYIADALELDIIWESETRSVYLNERGGY